MFQQSVHSGEESRRPWTFAVSLLAQALFIAIAVLIPLLAKPMLPALNAAVVSLQSPKPPRAAAPPPPSQIVAVRPQQFSSALVQPRRMPAKAAPLVDAPPPSVDYSGPFGRGSADPVLTGAVEDVRVAPVRPPPPEPEPEPPAAPISVSGGVQAAKIMNRVMPVYPEPARRIGIGGVVRLQAVIAADGTIAELTVVSGHPLLVQAAIDAVKQWRYRPTVLNGTPVPVNTRIDVNFTLGR